MPTRARDVLTNEEITPQEAWFADEYLIDFNGKYAAIRVGVRPSAASMWTTRRLRNPKVRAAIERRIATKRAQARDLRDEVINELRAIALSRHHHYMVDEHGNLTLNGVPLDQGDTAHAAIKRIEREMYYERDPKNPDVLRPVYKVKYELWDKNTALRNLGTHLGMFVERTATETAPEDLGSKLTVWEFGGKKIAF